MRTSRTGRQSLRQVKKPECQAYVRVIQPAHDVPVESVESCRLPNAFRLIQSYQHFVQLRQVHMQLLQEANTNNQSAEEALTAAGHRPSWDKTMAGITNPAWFLQAAALRPFAAGLLENWVSSTRGLSLTAGIVLA